jgi:hypothetical protein
MSRPKFMPTDEQRLRVKSLSAYGIKQEGIARMVGLRSPKTLRKYFQDELDLGAIEAVAQVSRVHFQMAKSGKHPASTIQFLNNRTRWLDVQSLETPPTAPKREVSRIVWIAAERPKRPAPPEPIKLDSTQPTGPATVPCDDLASEDAEEHLTEPENPNVITLQAENAKEKAEEPADD